MLQFLAGFTLGNVVGMYLAQNYDVPNIAKKLEDFKKDVEAKKKPPEWAKWDHVVNKTRCTLETNYLFYRVMVQWVYIWEKDWKCKI